MEKIKLPWGELIIVGATKTFSVGIDTIFPSKQTDREGTYLKKGHGLYVVLKGRGICGDKSIKGGDIMKIKEGQKINIRNDSPKNLTVVTIYMPPYNEANIGYET